MSKTFRHTGVNASDKGAKLQGGYKGGELKSKPDAGTRIWTSEHGWTPLMYCAKSRVGATDKKKAAVLAEIAHLLIASGASPDGCVDMAMENLAVLRAMPDAGAK